MTRKQMYERVEGIAELLGASASEEKAIELGHKEFLHIDIACGGYQLCWRLVESGGGRGFYGNVRMTNKDFDNYTKGIRDCLYYQDMLKRQH